MSGTVNALRIVRATTPQVSRGPRSPRRTLQPGRGLLDDLAGTAGGLDPLARRSAECMRVDGQRLAQLALGEDLDRDVLLAREALGPERVGGHLGAGVEALLERGEVHRLGVRAERLERHRLLHVRSAQFAHPHVDRVLAALEARPLLGARARSRALLAAPGGLAGTRALAAADALAGPAAAARRLEGVQPDPFLLVGHQPSSTFTRCATARTMPRSWGEASCSTLWPMRRSPSERSVSIWRGLAPLRDRRCVMRTLLMTASPLPHRPAWPRRRPPPDQRRPRQSRR